jgi:hypothetical protein
MTMEEQLRETIEKQYAVLEEISGIALNLPRLLIEALNLRGVFFGDFLDVAEEELRKIMTAHAEDTLLCNVITTLIKELRANGGRRIH